ncbi:MAG TPA: hypothetical protein VHZ76_00860 [Gammaproteobacteria bacterium]|jgi:hypothetical protein|nr:hypothetical protein [Gammaproteobacteria bacterium]
MKRELKAAYRQGMEDTIVTLEQSMLSLRVTLNKFPKEEERIVAHKVIDEILVFLDKYKEIALTEVKRGD